MAATVKKPTTPLVQCEKEDLKKTKEKTTAFGKKPIVLSSQRFNKITNNAYQMDKQKAQQEAEEEQKYKEYLKTGGERLVAQFTGNMQRTQDMKLQEIKEQMEIKEKQVKESFEQTKENANQKRREKIAEAQKILERLKPGPRELHSAVLQSEVLRARNVQRNINEEFEKAIKKQDCENQKLCEKIGAGWLNEEQQRVEEQQKAKNDYKQEIMQTIVENQRQKSEFKKQMIKEQQAAREAIDLEIKAQIEKEKAIMEKKRATLRKNALEAMKMVEQRRLRDRMVEEVEDRLCCVYNTGKRQLDIMRAEQNQKMMSDKQKKMEDQIKQISNQDEKIRAAEAERLRRDISTLQLKFTAEEQEKIRKDKAAKQARIEAYLKEMQEQKQAQLKAMEEKRFDMANRFKNMEVDCLFNEAQKQEQSRKIQELRCSYKEQIEEQKRIAAQRDPKHECIDNNAEKEHKYFFEYARDLMEDAQKKGRPLYPFIKTIQQYKRENQIDCDIKIPKHLESQITLAPQCTTRDKQQQSRLNKSDKEEKNPYRDSILQNCLKINEIIAKAEKMNDGSGDKKLDKCTMQCPYDCNQHKLFKKSPSKDDCASSSIVRYSMHELKKMNQFTPACH